MLHPFAVASIGLIVIIVVHQGAFRSSALKHRRIAQWRQDARVGGPRPPTVCNWVIRAPTCPGGACTLGVARAALNARNLCRAATQGQPVGRSSNSCTYGRKWRSTLACSRAQRLRRLPSCGAHRHRPCGVSQRVPPPAQIDAHISSSQSAAPRRASGLRRLLSKARTLARWRQRVHDATLAV